MRILFIYPSIGGNFRPSFHAGIASISAVLKKNNHMTQLFPLSSWQEKDKLIKRIKIYKPTLIGFTTTASTFPVVINASSLIKKIFPEIKIICGGVHVTIYPHILDRIPFLDGICLGEGEFSTLDLVNCLEQKRAYWDINGFWFRYKGKIIKNKQRLLIKNLDGLPFPDRDIFFEENSLYYKNQPFNYPNEIGLEFIFSRGCPFECTYCSNHALKKIYGEGFVRYRSPKKAVEEIKAAVKKYKPDYLQFHDDIFTLNKKWLKNFLTLYKKLKLKIPFNCNLRVGIDDKETLRQLKTAGCRGVLIGLESGDSYIRNKVLNKRISNKQIISSFKEAREVGLKTFAFCMMGLPKETPRHFLNTVKLIGRIQPDNYHMQIFYPYPGTKLFTYCEKKKLFRKRIKNNFVERMDTILNLPLFKRKDILYYFKNFYLLCQLIYDKKNIFKNIRSKIHFSLLAKPPSSRRFLFLQFLYKSDLKFFKCLRLIRKRIKYAKF